MECLSFPAAGKLSEWLKRNHGSATELWVRIFKKASGEPSVTWDECVVEAIKWGWIDGHKKSLDSVSYLQRLTPRRPKSNWSLKNREHAERVIAEGTMQPSGLHHVQEARKDGRWDAAYSGSADMAIPQDFLDAIEAEPAAKAFFATLNRANLYAVYYRLTTAKKPETRARRMRTMIEQLSRQEKFH